MPHLRLESLSAFRDSRACSFRTLLSYLHPFLFCDGLDLRLFGPRLLHKVHVGPVTFVPMLDLGGYSLVRPETAIAVLVPNRKIGEFFCEYPRSAQLPEIDTDPLRKFLAGISGPVGRVPKFFNNLEGEFVRGHGR